MIYLCSHLSALKSIDTNTKIKNVTVLLYNIESATTKSILEDKCKDALSSYQLEVDFCDLLFDSKEEINEKLFGSEKETLIIPGGNTFELKFVLMKVLGEQWEHFTDNFKNVIGVSAGCHILSPTILTATFADENRIRILEFKGLKKFNFLVKPHMYAEIYYDGLKKFYKCNDFYTIAEDGYLILDNDGNIIEEYKTLKNFY